MAIVTMLMAVGSRPPTSAPSAHAVAVGKTDYGTWPRITAREVVRHMPIPVTLTTNGVAISRGNTKVSASAGAYGSHMVMKNIDTPIRADANPVGIHPSR